MARCVAASAARFGSPSRPASRSGDAAFWGEPCETPAACARIANPHGPGRCRARHRRHVGAATPTRPRRYRGRLHCVTTWSVTDLHWSGWLLRDVWEHLIVPLAQPSGSARYLRAIGADRYNAALDIGDALSADVLVADRLDGELLSPAHGAPLRLVAPAHYGYKNVKHLVALTVHVEPPSTSGGSIQHPRARVGFEERHATISGRLLRWPYRLLIVPIALRGRAGARRGSP